MDRNEMQDHIFNTYLNLRYGLAIIAALLPLIVFGVAKLQGVDLQDSISDYYWAAVTGRQPPSRVWFIGGLFAVASGLYLYKGFSKRENYALNMAAILGVGVAVFPNDGNCTQNCGGGISIHGFCAVTMFLFLFYVVWFRAEDTLKHLPENAKPNADWFRKAFKVIAVFMLLSPLTAFGVNFVWGTDTSYIFAIEAVGIVAFAAYWFFKSWELSQSGAVKKAVQAELAV